MTTRAAPEGMRPGLAPAEFDVEFVAADGAQHTVPLADAVRVRLADMAPVAGSGRGRGSGTCLAAGGQRPMAGTWGMSRGWSATR
jgi:hypothetical protein